MSMVQGLDGSVILTSTVLGLQLRLESGKLRVFNPHTAKYLETYSEWAYRYHQAELQAQLAQQREESERQRAELAQQQVESERQRTELALQQAESERQWAAQLAAQLRALGIDPERFRQSE
jgi:multidrug efflux pump subunit AcrA (membrane-fusion protein)